MSLPHPHTAPLYLSLSAFCIMDMPSSFTCHCHHPQVADCTCEVLPIFSQASPAVKPLACPCQNAACGSATWPLVSCRSFLVKSERKSNGQAWPQQMRLKPLHVSAVQAHPSVCGDLHRGGRPEGHLHQLLPAHGAHLSLAEPSQHSCCKLHIRQKCTAPAAVLASTSAACRRFEGLVLCTPLQLPSRRPCSREGCMPFGRTMA